MIRGRRKTVHESSAPAQSTLALAGVLEWLARQRHPRVLDLGGASGENVAFLTPYGCRLEILDLYARLGEAGRVGAPSERSIADVVARSLADAEAEDIGRPIDLVFAWDLFDYLSLAQIGEVYAAFGERLRVGSRLLAMVSYVGNIPLHPRRLRFAGNAHLTWDDEAPRVRTSPRHTEPQLLKRMPGLAVEQSYLLRQGYREIVFRRTHR